MAKRSTIYFPAEAARMLSALALRCNLGDGPDVLRAAIEAYAELIELTLDGSTMSVHDRKGTTYPYSPFARLDYPGLRAAGPSPAEKKDEDGGRDAPRNFVFSKEVMAKIEWIKTHSYLKTNAQAIRAALTSFSELIAVSLNGDSVVICDPDGYESLYSPFAPRQCSRPVATGRRSADATNGAGAPAGP